MDIKDKRIGVWGYGVGGKALVNFLVPRGAHVLLFDQRPLSASDVKHVQATGVRVCDSIDQFIHTSDAIVPSAGIDVRTQPASAPKLIAELDLFAHFFTQPIIAVTGTLGKTTVTTLLAHLLERAGKRVAVGGNIGVGLCSLIDQHDTVDYAVLEVSSFQLELTRTFTPQVAVWTTFYPNHLDRHASIDEYFAAKAQIVKRQRGDMISVVPSAQLAAIKQYAEHEHVWHEIPATIARDIKPFIARQQGIAYNWQVVALTLRAMGIDLQVLREPFDCAIEHRIELVRTLNEVSFYNDSKATVPEATLAAVARFYPRQIVLLLGGLSKGVNRESLVRALAGRVKHIVCFGKEAAQLADWCAQYHVKHSTAYGLAEAVKIGYTYSGAGEVVLLSPAGSSFDLFTNYQERGKVFKHLVHQL